MSNNKLTVLNLRRFPLMRLQFIEAMFIEHGFVSRKIITAALGIEAAMASRDMATYSTLNDTVYINHSAKRWEAMPEFRAVDGLLAVNAAEYLAASGVVFGFTLREISRTKTELGVIK
ncbi:hypothetical protein OGX80_21910 [Citrobacter sp. CK194]|uniref:hypothetical protein n=1 Tax=Citrobacter sp. CK194 TaxID=2985103 RepID=UPI0025789FDD|nr:hypothetical protein [Citrobacter sp. CK194]MDM3027469.1 hypothetical protein [Citrobacter sp. CK194]